MVLAGRPAREAARPPEQVLARAEARAENWDTRAALLWTLVTAERFDAVAAALRADARRGRPLRQRARPRRRVQHARSAQPAPRARSPRRTPPRGSRCACCRRATSRPGSRSRRPSWPTSPSRPASSTRRRRCSALLPQDGWPAGVGTVLIPATRGRLRLAQGRAAGGARRLRDLRRDVQPPTLWGTRLRDVGYLHARSGAALALLRLGERDRALELAGAELEDVRAFGAPRALGIALRVAGLACGGERGLALLADSVATLQRLAGAARARAFAGRARRGAAPCGPARRGARAARRRARPRRPLRRPAARRARARGAQGHRRPAAPRVAHRARRRSRPASCASRASRPRAAPTARSPTSST